MISFPIIILLLIKTKFVVETMGSGMGVAVAVEQKASIRKFLTEIFKLAFAMRHRQI